jgi:hypothetical protein
MVFDSSKNNRYLIIFLCFNLLVLSLSAKKNVNLPVAKKKLVVANKVFVISTQEVYSEFKKIMDDKNLAWGGAESVSKRLALTSVLKNYKKALGPFWSSFNLAAKGKLNERKQQFVVKLQQAAFDKAKKEHEAMVGKMMSIKTSQEKMWKKELSDLMRNVSPVLPTIVDLEVAGVASRREFVDSFVKNIETFFQLYNGRFQSMTLASEGH